MGINMLPELQLGQAYLVKTQNAATVTFPENMTKAEAIVNPKQADNLISAVCTRMFIRSE
jgi:hypothetical protein